MLLLAPGRFFQKVFTLSDDLPWYAVGECGPNVEQFAFGFGYFFFPLTSLKDFLEQGGIMNKIKKINR